MQQSILKFTVLDVFVCCLFETPFCGVNHTTRKTTHTKMIVYLVFWCGFEIFVQARYSCFYAHNTWRNCCLHSRRPWIEYSALTYLTVVPSIPERMHFVCTPTPLDRSESVNSSYWHPLAGILTYTLLNVTSILDKNICVGYLFILLRWINITHFDLFHPLLWTSDSTQLAYIWNMDAEFCFLHLFLDLFAVKL